jgi:hypothetical protein
MAGLVLLSGFIDGAQRMSRVEQQQAAGPSRLGEMSGGRGGNRWWRQQQRGATNRPGSRLQRRRLTGEIGEICGACCSDFAGSLFLTSWIASR